MELLRYCGWDWWSALVISLGIMGYIVSFITALLWWKTR